MVAASYAAEQPRIKMGVAPASCLFWARCLCVFPDRQDRNQGNRGIPFLAKAVSCSAYYWLLELETGQISGNRNSWRALRAV
ncbi:MAG: hypothetical protein KatS3mg110_2843 [Pirellulaceae bacterium]|nr:MAG: hypothetical protein KatS3mg110_2843 [Pirellulaceae bacterium]